MAVSLRPQRGVVIATPAPGVVVDDRSSAVVVDNPAPGEVVSMRTLVVERTVGAPGDQSVLAVAGENLQANGVVWISTNDEAYMASSLDLVSATRVVGVAKTAALTGEDVEIVFAGSLHRPGLPPGPLYLGVSGELTSDRDTGIVELRVATAVTADRMIVRVEPSLSHT